MYSYLAFLQFLFLLLLLLLFLLSYNKNDAIISDLDRRRLYVIFISNAWESRIDL